MALVDNVRIQTGYGRGEIEVGQIVSDIRRRRAYRAWAYGSRNAPRSEIFARDNAFRSDGVFRRSVEMVDKQSSDDVYRTRMELRRKKITDIQIILFKQDNGGGQSRRNGGVPDSTG